MFDNEIATGSNRQVERPASPANRVNPLSGFASRDRDKFGRKKDESPYLAQTPHRWLVRNESNSSERLHFIASGSYSTYILYIKALE
jgi:hypothetical protein